MRLPRDQSPNDDSRPERAQSEAAGITDEHVGLQSKAHGRTDSNSSGNSTAKHTLCIDYGSSGKSECGETDGELSNELEGLALAQQSPPRYSLGHDLPHLHNVRQSSHDQVVLADLYNATPRSSPSPHRTTMTNQTDPGTHTNNDGDFEVCNEGAQTLPDIESLNLEQGRSSRYDVGGEPLPREPYFNKGFQKALKLATGVASDLVKSMTRCSQSQIANSELSKHLMTARVLQDYSCAASRTVGIVGDMSSGKFSASILQKIALTQSPGKSSLINSLLNIRDLAKTGDLGTAVTSLVTEYRYRQQRHTAPFSIEVEYCTKREIDEQLQELLIDYREWWRPGLLDGRSESGDELHDIEKKSKCALDTIQNIFGEIPQTDPHRLKDFSDGAFASIYCDLSTLACDLKWPAGAENGTWATTALDVKECQKKVEIFKEKGLWPLTNIIRIFLSAQVLKSGIILADLPGYHDINLARVKKAQQYLVQCDEIFIVARIWRIVDDPSVAGMIRAQLRSDAERSKSIALICTSADEIDIPKAEEHYHKIANLATTQKAKAWVREAYEISVPLYLLAEVKYKHIYAAARNEDVTSGLALKYPHLAGNGRSNVFCIGNEDYNGYKLKHDSPAHITGISGSGVPKLRSFCHSITARAQFKASNHFLTVDVPSLVQSVEVWLDGSQRTTVAAIPTGCVSELEKRIKARFEESQQVIAAYVKNQVIEAISASYKAWVRNNGTHYTLHYGYNCWNTELLYEMNKTLPAQWDVVEKNFRASLTDLEHSIKQDFFTLTRQLQDSHIPETVMSLVRLKEQDFCYTMTEEAEKFARAIGTCRYNTTGAHVSSYALETMIPIYRACNAESGSGARDRMYNIMRESMKQRPVFKHIHSQTEAYLLVHTELMRVAASEKLESVCQSIQELLGALKGPESEASKSSAEDVERIKDAVAAARAKLNDIEREAKDAREEAGALGY